MEENSKSRSNGFLSIVLQQMKVYIDVYINMDFEKNSKFCFLFKILL